MCDFKKELTINPLPSNSRKGIPISSKILKKRIWLSITGCLALFVAMGYLLPEKLAIPVKGGQTSDWNQMTFWYEPWGKSGTHKGIDIFARRGTPLLSATNGFVIFNGELEMGGRVIAVLGPKWKVHYYAHLESANVSKWSVVKYSQEIGTIGDSGNAKGKPPHVHYSVITLLPYFWRWDTSTQGWKKIFYLNPSKMLLSKTD